MITSVLLAKQGFIHPLILDEFEIEKILEIEKYKISVTNILSVSNVKILQSNGIIYYVIKIPNIFEDCNLVKMYPVIKNNKIIKLNSIYSAKCQLKNFPLNHCKQIINEYVCKVFEDQCISELMNQNFANCPTTTPNEIDLIEVDDGIIYFLNNVINTKVKEEKEEFILNGILSL